MITFCFVSASIIWSMIKQPKYWWQDFRKTRSFIEAKKAKAKAKNPKLHENASEPTPLFSLDQLRIIDKFRQFQNNPWSLLKVCIPCLLSVGLCPIAIFLVPTMWDYFFPFDDTRKANINGTLSPFLLPSSLVYSLAWGFALQDALRKFDTTDENSKHHYALLKQIRELVVHCGALKAEEKRSMLNRLGLCITQWMRRQMGEMNHCNGKDISFVVFLPQI